MWDELKCVIKLKIQQQQYGLLQFYNGEVVRLNCREKWTIILSENEKINQDECQEPQCPINCPTTVIPEFVWFFLEIQYNTWNFCCLNYNLAHEAWNILYIFCYHNHMNDKFTLIFFHNYYVTVNFDKNLVNLKTVLLQMFAVQGTGLVIDFVYAANQINERMNFNWTELISTIFNKFLTY